MSNLSAAGGPLNLRHLGKQILAGIILGAIAGYAEKNGHEKVALGVIGGVIVITSLDHLGIIRCPWGYHGPGYGDSPIKNPGLGKCVWCVIDFPVRNAALAVSFVGTYGTMTGHLECSSSGCTWK